MPLTLRNRPAATSSARGTATGPGGAGRGGPYARRGRTRLRTIIYDAGALIAAEDGAERMWALHKRALARGVQPVIPTTVLAEVWRGGRGQHRLGLFIQSCDVEGLSEESARLPASCYPSRHTASSTPASWSVPCAEQVPASLATAVTLSSSREHVESTSSTSDTKPADGGPDGDPLATRRSASIASNREVGNGGDQRQRS